MRLRNIRRPDLSRIDVRKARVVVDHRVKKLASQRARELLRVLDPQRRTHGDPLERVAAVLEHAGIDEFWLAMTTLRADFPQPHEVSRLFRVAAVRGDGEFAVAEILKGISTWRPPHVRIADGEVLVDVFHTSRTHLATGIQRVTREVSRRWNDSHDLTLVGWTDTHSALRELAPSEQKIALYGGEYHRPAELDTVIVPWRGTYVVPELIAEFQRGLRLLAMIRHSGCRTGAVGHDCIPLTTAETIDSGMGGHFAGWLASVREMDAVAATCKASRAEYEGWKAMLVGVGVEGPAIRDVLLPADIGESDEATIERMRRRMTMPGVPCVLCVGSHEPRKNQLALLHAAELLWRDGVEFTMTFIGGSGWRGEAFAERVQQLIDDGRPIENLSGINDDELWAAYRVADVTTFPSLNEGFGLPVVESLAVGTPVVTSDYGSMAEIAEAGGAITVDPRDDRAIAEGLRRVLTDPALRAELSTAALARPSRDWDSYAAETWAFLVEGVDPDRAQTIAAGSAADQR